MRLNQRNVLKLKAGNTVWRCLIWFPDEKPVVSISEIHLVGVVRRSGASRCTCMSVLYDGELYSKMYLSDIASAAAFTTRRGALKYQREVSEGLHSETVAWRRDLLGLMS